MKKTLVTALGLAVLAGSALAQTNIVLSRNAVGYVKVSAVRSNLHFVTHNFVALDGAPVTVTNLIGAQVPNGSSVIVWDPAAQAYRFENRIAGFWFPGTNRLVPGRGFWLRVPPTAASNSYQVYLMGEVPDRFTLPTNTQQVLPGLNMVGNPYPITTRFTNLTIATTAINGDAVIFWDDAAQAYRFENRIAGFWFPGTNEVRPGRGFWYRSSRTTNIVWQQVKPYTWP